MNSEKTTIETSVGTIWVALFDNGDARVWWPPTSAVHEPAREVVRGRAWWNPKYNGWIVPAKHCEDVLADFEDI